MKKPAFNSQYLHQFLKWLDSLWHTRHERLNDVIWNISPGGEQSLKESTHILKLRLFFINVSCYQSPEYLDMVQVRWSRLKIQKTNVISLNKILWPTSSVNCNIIQLKNPVEKSSFLRTNEPLQWRALIVLTYRCIQLRL